MLHKGALHYARSRNKFKRKASLVQYKVKMDHLKGYQSSLSTLNQTEPCTGYFLVKITLEIEQIDKQVYITLNIFIPISILTF